MTETLGHSDIATRVHLALKAFGSLLAKAGFGLTTFIGIMLAIAAVFLTFAHGFNRSRRKAEPVDNQTLEARRTADGWVIEI
jgi:hypothetical protein